MPIHDDNERFRPIVRFDGETGSALVVGRDVRDGRFLATDGDCFTALGDAGKVGAEAAENVAAANMNLDGRIQRVTKTPMAGYRDDASAPILLEMSRRSAGLQYASEFAPRMEDDARDPDPLNLPEGTADAEYAARVRESSPERRGRPVPTKDPANLVAVARPDDRNDHDPHHGGHALGLFHEPGAGGRTLTLPVKRTHPDERGGWPEWRPTPEAATAASEYPGGIPPAHAADEMVRAAGETGSIDVVAANRDLHRRPLTLLAARTDVEETDRKAGGAGRICDDVAKAAGNTLADPDPARASAALDWYSRVRLVSGLDPDSPETSKAEFRAPYADHAGRRGTLEGEVTHHVEDDEGVRNHSVNVHGMDTDGEPFRRVTHVKAEEFGGGYIHDEIFRGSDDHGEMKRRATHKSQFVETDVPGVRSTIGAWVDDYRRSEVAARRDGSGTFLLVSESISRHQGIPEGDVSPKGDDVGIRGEIERESLRPDGSRVPGTRTKHLEHMDRGGHRRRVVAEDETTDAVNDGDGARERRNRRGREPES